VREFQRHASKYLKELPIVLTHYDKPIATLTAYSVSSVDTLPESVDTLSTPKSKSVDTLPESVDTLPESVDTLSTPKSKSVDTLPESVDTLSDNQEEQKPKPEFCEHSKVAPANPCHNPPEHFVSFDQENEDFSTTKVELWLCKKHYRQYLKETDSV